MKKRNMFIGAVVAVTILATYTAMAFASSRNFIDVFDIKGDINDVVFDLKNTDEIIQVDII